MINLSVIVITLNEELNIENCLKSVSWANDVVVVDSFSTDKTVEIARKFTDKVFITEWKGFSETKNFAIDKTSNDWVLWLDADEVVSDELAEEIKRVVSGNSDFSAYMMPRRSFFLGKWIKHCGWYPGYVTRLFKKEKGRFGEETVHEFLRINGKIGKLKSDMLHYTDPNLEHYFKKFNRYTTLSASELKAKEKRAGILDLLIRPFVMFVKMYFLKLGFLDGVQGFILCILSSLYVFTKYAKLWEINRE